MDINMELEKCIELFDTYLRKILADTSVHSSALYESMEYSLFTGGKRLRPILAIKSFEIFHDNVNMILPFAAAIEMIHTYSLIHDDLPCMDNDDFRRGKPTSHKVYGEAMAVLTGDGLLNFAFESLSAYTARTSRTVGDYKKNIAAIDVIGKCSGVKGMIGGQVLDLYGSAENMDEDMLLSMYRRKTGALIEASIVAGGIIGRASDDDIEILREFGENLGLAYQINDDILDSKQDSKIDKFTYLNYHSIEEAKLMVTDLSQKALKALDKLDGKDTEFLKGLTEILVNRHI